MRGRIVQKCRLTGKFWSSRDAGDSSDASCGQPVAQVQGRPKLCGCSWLASSSTLEESQAGVDYVLRGIHDGRRIPVARLGRAHARAAGREQIDGEKRAR